MTPHHSPRSTLSSPDRAPATPPPADPLTVAQRRILDAVRKRPMTAGEITFHALGSHVKTGDRDAMLAGLMNRGLVTATCRRDERTGLMLTLYSATPEAPNHAGRDC